jgi:hypothetical protein
MLVGAIVALLGHVCVLPVDAHGDHGTPVMAHPLLPGDQRAGTHPHPAVPDHDRDATHEHGLAHTPSCDAAVAATLSLPTADSTGLIEPALDLVRAVAPPATCMVAESPPLFVLHAALLI